MSKADFMRPAEKSGPFTIDGLGDIYIREVPGSESDYVGQGAKFGQMNTVARIIVSSVVDAEGKAVFSHDDIDGLLSMPAMKLQPLMAIAVKHSGFGADVENIVGNS